MYTFPAPVMKNKMLVEATLTGWPRCCQLYVRKLYLVVTPLTSLYTCFCLPLALLKFNSLCSTSSGEGQSCCKNSGNGLGTDIVILLFKGVEKGNFHMPARAREVFMVGKEDTFALLHCERLWLNCCSVCPWASLVYGRIRKIKFLFLGNVMVMILCML